MAVVTRKRQKQTTYYVTFLHEGKKVWENAGHDEREAQRLNRRRHRELKAGTYRPTGLAEQPTVGDYGEAWLDRRTCRWAESEATYLRTHVLSRPWFANLLVEDLEPRHMMQLATELKTAWSDRYERHLSGILQMERSSRIPDRHGRRGRASDRSPSCLRARPPVCQDQPRTPA